jgi:hypothetical protein
VRPQAGRALWGCRVADLRADIHNSLRGRLEDSPTDSIECYRSHISPVPQVVDPDERRDLQEAGSAIPAHSQISDSGSPGVYPDGVCVIGDDRRANRVIRIEIEAAGKGGS